VDAADVRVGDELLLRDGRVVGVEGVRHGPYHAEVYNVEVEDLHCYAVGPHGVLLHNENGEEVKTKLEGEAGGQQEGPVKGQAPEGGFRDPDNPEQGTLWDLNPEEGPAGESDLPPFKKGGKTSGRLETPTENIPLKSGRAGPASSMPEGSSGFDIVSRTHVEGHAAAWMRQHGVTEATLRINNPVICDSCMANLPRMLAPGSRLTIVTIDGAAITFTGGSRSVSALWPGGTTVMWLL
jgi:hypothetical protein